MLPIAANSGTVGQVRSRVCGEADAERAAAVLEAAQASPLYAYVVVSLTTGIRTEEARALQWDHVVAWVDDTTGWQPVTEVGFDHEHAHLTVNAAMTWCSITLDTLADPAAQWRQAPHPGEPLDAN
jgi:hypothetical protein